MTFWHERRPATLDDACEDIRRIVSWLRCLEGRVDVLGQVVSGYSTYGNEHDGWYIVRRKGSTNQPNLLYCAGGIFFSNDNFTEVMGKVNVCQGFGWKDVEILSGPLSFGTEQNVATIPACVVIGFMDGRK